MAIATRVRELGQVLLDLFYPQRCVGCGRTGVLYCAACRDAASLISPPFCSLCGQPTQDLVLCHTCRAHPLRIEGIRSCAMFEGALRRAIHAFKYRYIRGLAPVLGEMLVQAWERLRLPADVVVPVPLHRRRQRERGYNQARLLAEHLGRAASLEVVGDTLRRNRYTLSQTGLDAIQRQQNVAGAFRCDGRVLRDRRVLLVDDVCTTGATLQACSMALKAGGAQSVWALTVARARFA